MLPPNCTSPDRCAASAELRTRFKTPDQLHHDVCPAPGRSAGLSIQALQPPDGSAVGGAGAARPPSPAARQPVQVQAAAAAGPPRGILIPNPRAKAGGAGARLCCHGLHWGYRTNSWQLAQASVSLPPHVWAAAPPSAVGPPAVLTPACPCHCLQNPQGDLDKSRTSYVIMKRQREE